LYTWFSAIDCITAGVFLRSPGILVWTPKRSSEKATRTTKAATTLTVVQRLRRCRNDLYTSLTLMLLRLELSSIFSCSEGLATLSSVWRACGFVWRKEGKKEGATEIESQSLTSSSLEASPVPQTPCRSVSTGTSSPRRSAIVLYSSDGAPIHLGD
jgi:hypothetical protein